MFAFIILGVTIIVCMILRIQIKKTDASQEKSETEFWEREQQANFTRRKNLDNIEYLTIPLEKIPQNLHTDAEKTLVQLSECRMLNLTGKTNTDLKLEYGASNLETLSEYDNNFSLFIENTYTYAKELMDAGQTDAARALLELAVSYHADSSKLYVLLAEIYQNTGETQKIQELVDSVKNLNPLSGNIISEKLSPYLS